jgi:hypothetical protein
MRTKKQIEQIQTVTCNNLPELYLAVWQCLDDYFQGEELDPSDEGASALIKRVFPQMRDERISKAINVIQLNSGLRPDDSAYVQCCPQCLIECIHEAEHALITATGVAA